MRLVHVVAMLAALAAPVSAGVVRGKVIGGAGYAILGTATNGRAASQRLRPNGAFRLDVAPGASLQLVGPDGRYFGPIVLRHQGTAAYLGLTGRAVNLHAIVLRDGFAQPKRPAPRRATDLRHAAVADASGQPLGAGRLGVVAAPHPVRRLTAADGTGSGPGDDDDGDGIINAYDADDDGDLVLDGSDPDSAASSNDGIFTTLFVTDLQRSLNVNVGSVDRAVIDTLIRDAMQIVFYFDDGQFPGTTVTSVDVDCFSLPYCARGSGVATITRLTESAPGSPQNVPWISYDPNGDGLPNLEPIMNGGRPAHAASIIPMMTTGQIHAGDAFDVVVTTTTGTVTLARSLSPYFVTTPAVVGFDAGAGPQAVTYPISPGAPGTGGNPIVMSREQLALTFYRPQRPAIPGAESGDWVDMGHLHWGIPLHVGNQEVACGGHYTDLSSTLAAASGADFAAQLFPLTDAADDAAPDPSHLLSFTIDLGACLRANGVDPTGMDVQVGLTAVGQSRPGGVDRAAQFWNVRLP